MDSQPKWPVMQKTFYVVATSYPFDYQNLWTECELQYQIPLAPFITIVQL